MVSSHKRKEPHVYPVQVRAETKLLSVKLLMTTIKTSNAAAVTAALPLRRLVARGYAWASANKSQRSAP